MTAMKSFFDQVKNGKHAIMGAALATMLSTGMAYAADGTKYAPTNNGAMDVIATKVSEYKESRSKEIDFTILKKTGNAVSEADRLLDNAFHTMKYSLDRLDQRPTLKFGEPQTVESLLGGKSFHLSADKIPLSEAKEIIDAAKTFGLDFDAAYQNIEERAELLSKMEDRLGDILQNFYENDVVALKANISALEAGIAQHDKLSHDAAVAPVKRM